MGAVEEVPEAQAPRVALPLRRVVSAVPVVVPAPHAVPPLVDLPLAPGTRALRGRTSRVRGRTQGVEEEGPTPREEGGVGTYDLYRGYLVKSCFSRIDDKFLWVGSSTVEQRA